MNVRTSRHVTSEAEAQAIYYKLLMQFLVTKLEQCQYRYKNWISFVTHLAI